MGSGGSTGRLRGELTEFVGRRAELALVREALGVARLVTLTGPGGIGKTRLALQAADHARRAFRDGVWLAGLGGLRDPALLVAEVARSLGLSDQSPHWAVAALADYLAGRQLLLVLDDAASSDQVRPLLPGAGGCLVLVTSRRHLSALEDARAISLDTLPPGEAAALLVRLAAGPG